MAHHLTTMVATIAALSLVALVSSKGDAQGIKWAVLVAGSNGYMNYRHQADICHAYQILKKGGLRDENIIVFMYDDIAFNEDNPRQGVIINRPHGGNLYPGVPKVQVHRDGDRILLPKPPHAKESESFLIRTTTMGQGRNTSDPSSSLY